MIPTQPMQLSLIAQSRLPYHFVGPWAVNIFNPIDHPDRFAPATVVKRRLRAVIAEDRARCGDGKWIRNPTIDFVGVDAVGRFLFTTGKKMRYRWTPRL